MLNWGGKRVYNYRHINSDHNSNWYKLRNERGLIPAADIYDHRNVSGFKNKIPYLI